MSFLLQSIEMILAVTNCRVSALLLLIVFNQLFETENRHITLIEAYHT